MPNTSNTNLDNSTYKDNCVKVNAENLEFELCADISGIIIRHNGMERRIDFADFENPRALRVILHEDFGYNIDSQINSRLALIISNNREIHEIINKLRSGEEYRVCIRFKNNECAGVYIVANVEGIFVINTKTLENGDVMEQRRLISSIKVRKIETIKFSGIFDVNFDEKFVKITTVDRILTGSIDEVTTLIRSKYGLEQPEKFKFLLNLEYPQTSGYYSIGPWFDGEKLSIATESLYNPPWKSLSSYKLPPQDISPEKKKEVLKRILATIESYKDPSTVTWILSFGVISNFAHYLRQKIGYFPHVILIGDKKTGKTTLTTLNKYLYWGNNPLPPEKPKTESQLRRLLSQSTLLTPIEEWNEISSDNQEIDEMLLLLHSSAQRFVLKKITTSNPDFNGVFLSLSSVLADANFNRDIDTSSLDKIIFIEIEKSNGIDLAKAEQNNALLKQKLMANYQLHDILHALGLELIQIAAEKLKTFDFNKERSELLNSLIQIGYSSWLDLFSRYNIALTSDVQLGFIEFPLPHVNIVRTDDDETELEIAFNEFIHEKIKELGTDNVPVDKHNLVKYGFYFEDGNTVAVSSDLIKEFKKWLDQRKGITLAYSKERILSKLGAVESSRSLGGKKVRMYTIQLLQVDFQE